MPRWTFQDFANRRMVAMLLLGFASGLPFELTGTTLKTWMSTAGVDIETIGLFALVSLPYGYKFLWASLFDAWAPGFLDRRRSWMVVLQLALLVSIAATGLVSPTRSPLLLAAFALALCFFAASHDIVLDAYRTDVLPEHERGPGVSLWSLGFRAAMLTSGGVALIIGDVWGWRAAYLSMAGVMGLMLLSTLLAPSAPDVAARPQSVRDVVITPLVAFLERERAVWLLALLLLYKLCDSYAATLGAAFLVQPGGLEFSPTDIATIYKGLGLAATMAGVVAGGVALVKLGLYRGLLVFGLLQAVTNGMFMVLAEVGHHYPTLVATILIEKFAGGMGDVPFLALLMALCDKRFSAFQYALLSSIPAIGRSMISATAGYAASYLGWTLFFGFTALVAIPGLILLVWLRPTIGHLDDEVNGRGGESTSPG